MKKITCNSVSYRKGFIEVSANIHQGCVNIETWSIHTDVDISDAGLSFGEIPEGEFTGNTELELNLESAESLLIVLQNSILEMKESLSKEQNKNSKN